MQFVASQFRPYTNLALINDFCVNIHLSRLKWRQYGIWGLEGLIHSNFPIAVTMHDLSMPLMSYVINLFGTDASTQDRASVCLCIVSVITFVLFIRGVPGPETAWAKGFKRGGRP